MVKNGDCVAIFNSIHRVMKAEKVLKELRLPILLIPAPRPISSDCGLAIRYSVNDRERVESVLGEAGLIPEDIFLKKENSYLNIKTLPSFNLDKDLRRI